MSRHPVVPEGEALRKAVRWLGERGEHSLAVIEAACRQFDLSPADEAFLLRHFLQQDARKKRPGMEKETAGTRCG